MSIYACGSRWLLSWLGSAGYKYYGDTCDTVRMVPQVKVLVCVDDYNVLYSHSDYHEWPTEHHMRMIGPDRDTPGVLDLDQSSMYAVSVSCANIPLIAV